MNFHDFTTVALNCTNKVEYDDLVASHPTISSDFGESGSTFVKYFFIPKNNEDQLYDAISICFCPECESKIDDDNTPCEECFPQDSDEDYDDDL